jgi:hypothetical protein
VSAVTIVVVYATVPFGAQVPQVFWARAPVVAAAKIATEYFIFEIWDKRKWIRSVGSQETEMQVNEWLRTGSYKMDGKKREGKRAGEEERRS